MRYHTSVGTAQQQQGQQRHSRTDGYITLNFEVIAINLSVAQMVERGTVELLNDAPSLARCHP